ncbi:MULTISPECIES: 30S ribosomal protein S14 [Chlamydia]|uniref:Small ribosomal subunit protein uS14 n=2 Tax=Chlamydia TaxID=810 RepID=RS14_CHLAB|nr:MULTISPECIES: 30S ribosomal protein S14 [Chlamydia]Q255T5.1 RecName: Full=Small ribosomal subunit protein uS14; AltName: Full=30S ribosomal protein S14 [Chlamydia felis Fe/C-56]Q5L550.1 RecName: Full=Small ribosomal subunit protein uS14; AltName: Full=30S ribosomal protein S14 [Chlamydia abortus S26/3]ASD30908.1 30S ribosomal protein S14 [Chlamydia abortus]AUS60285.1 SSU ribosomal protein S14p/ S29e [Chlamydia abortus]EGK69536.1 30S ribosomal protein S14 [Chlamydia abortus LLG]QRR31553.1 3
MAKKSAVARENKRRKLVEANYKKRSELRKIAKSLTASEEEKENARVALNKMKRDTAPIRLHNRCLLTGRPRGYLRKFAISRICFRQMASMGEIPGVVKASW